jgi:hypothetical protein
MKVGAPLEPGSKTWRQTPHRSLVANVGCARMRQRAPATSATHLAGVGSFIRAPRDAALRGSSTAGLPEAASLNHKHPHHAHSQ